MAIRSAFRSCAALASLFAAGTAQAQAQDSSPPERGHLLQVTVHGGAAWLGGDSDGHYPQHGAYTGIGVGYSRATRGVDLGVAFDYLLVPDGNYPRHAIIPALTLRFHLPLSEQAEFGLGLRAGWSWVLMPHVADDSGRFYDHTFSGLHLGLAPHVRFWVVPRFALDIGGELLVAGGGDSISNDVKTSYLERSARISAFGGFVRANFGL